MNRNTKATTTSYGGGSFTPSTSGGLCGELVGNLYLTNEQLLNIEGRLRTLADRLFSERPEVARDSEAPPLGSINLLEWSINEVNHKIEGVVSQLERLEQL